MKEYKRSRQNRIENHRENLARNQDQNPGFPIISFSLDGDPQHGSLEDFRSLTWKIMVMRAFSSADIKIKFKRP